MEIVKFFNKILDLIFPKREIVRKIEESPVEKLRNEIPHPEKFDENIYSALSYKNEITQTIIWEIKYRGNRKIVKIAAEILNDEINEKLGELKLFSNFSNPILIPIPISPKRHRQRGFNQSFLIADELEKITSKENFILNKNILVKTKDTISQTKTRNRSERLKNLKGCFQVKNPETIRNRNIILLDDVTTTGSTLSEAKKTLLKAGAKRVIAITVAH